MIKNLLLISVIILSIAACFSAQNTIPQFSEEECNWICIEEGIN